jgi:hypothetical protein
MTSNYDKWELGGRPAARGASKKWVNRLGRTVEVLRADDEGIDGDGMPWLAVCTDHGNLVSVTTKRDAIDCCRDTTQFCGQCRKETQGERQ